ncbi:MAG: DEAD/DEAH box helicase [Saprospiraceae bacterium]|nr:DEAD/DEAH box helicase [Saprospiraceae bacterium]MDW8484402.1 AAA domain-containing protein [Saprospiraceae bacterium]
MASEQAKAIYSEIVRLATHANWSTSDRVLALADVQDRLFEELTKAEQLFFSTSFARISYAAHKYHLSAEAMRVIHHFRRIASRVRARRFLPSESEVSLGVWALAEAVEGLLGYSMPEEVRALSLLAKEQLLETPAVVGFRELARVVVIADVPEEHCLLAYDEECPEKLVRVRYHLPDRNENFTPTIRLLQKVFPLPTTIHLIEVDIDQAGDYRPRAFVVEPDYLMDVTHVAERFQPNRVEPMGFLVKKFLPYEMSAAALVGNIANYFLDRLMNEPDAEFASLIRETFALYPLVYAPMSDQEVKEVVTKAQLHYANLRGMAQKGFRQQGIEPTHCVLEPTFYSSKYGLQGRLDLFYRNSEQAAIVELKSGHPFRPNTYGISRSHFTQILLYDLLVRSVFGSTLNPAKYILYSGAEENHLRFGPTVEPEQWEALQVRNQLVAIERLLTGIRPGQLSVPLFERLCKMAEDAPSAAHDFTLKEISQFATVYSALNDVEKKYFNAFVGFIAREHWQAKVGAEGADAFSSSAALWRNSLAEKQAAFAILAQMELVENRANQAEPIIVFRRTEKTNSVANFRVGDLAVLYPADEENATVLQHQVIKCTIVELSPQRVTVQLRARQFNLKPFEAHQRWNLELDSLESSFISLYRSLYEWAKAAPWIRARWLCPPLSERRTALQEAPSAEYIATAPDFFLLWGPPGTGKTSIVLRNVVQWVLRNTRDNLVLLAYTNRAVDEICEVLEALDVDYIRIGAPFATGERFRRRLLSQRIASAQTRAELRAILDPVRLFVSTVSSFAQADNLFKVKTFQRLIVDEASQILEPQLIGLLSRFQHVVLIGDHHQLPAVVAQEPELTRVDDPDLKAIGLTDLRDSYFERLYRYCQQHGLHRNCGSLCYQGRMHADIMAFSSRYFYGGRLHTLPLPQGERQHQPLRGVRGLLAQRVCFVPVVSPHALPHQRICVEEARWVARITRYFRQLAKRMGQPWNPEHTLGIITPWRAQIAQIQQALAEEGLDPDELTIDTVERFQGGARDIILISCCVHSKQQLHRLVSLSAEGVDRKLNVALTRARERLFMLGNPHVLSEDPRYRAFIEQYKVDMEQFQAAYS